MSITGGPAGDWGTSRVQRNDDPIRQEARELRARVADLEAGIRRLCDEREALALPGGPPSLFVPIATLRALVGDETPEEPLGDHPHANPGDGRPQCPTCGKFVWPVIHSCKGIRVAPVDPTSPEWR